MNDADARGIDTDVFEHVRSEPGAILAPTMKNVAEEISAGTSMSQAESRPPPRTQRRAPCVADGVTETAQHAFGVIARRRGLGHARLAPA